MLFRNENVYIKILSYLFPLAIILMFTIYISSFFKKRLEEKEWFKNLFLFVVYGVASSAVIIPISDKGHFAVGSICTIIGTLYLMYVAIKFILRNWMKHREKVLKVIKVLTAIVFVFIICYSIYLDVQYLNSDIKRTDIKHFKNIIIENYLYNRITGIDGFIEEVEKIGKEVYVLDTSAALFSIPLDKYYKNYDMFNIGNFGAEGEERNYRRLKAKREHHNINKTKQI